MGKSDASSPGWEQDFSSLLASAPPQERRRLLELLKEKETRRRWSRDPLEYFRERFGIRPETIRWSLLPEYREHTWDGDKDPLYRVVLNVEERKWTAVESATGTGKTFLGALLVLRFLERNRDAMVVTTAPKKEQLALHIWKEIQRLYPKYGLGELQALRLRMAPPYDSWSAVGFVAGVKASEVQASASKAQGFHAENMLVIFEETPGIHESVVTAFENTAVAPNNILVAFGNPNHQRDTLHRFASRPNVAHIRISGLDHPNVVLNDPSFVPGAQTRVGIERILQKYGSVTHPMYLSRAKGVSPRQSSDAIIRWDWCMAATHRQREALGTAALGVDVANSVAGDPAALAFGHGSVLEDVLAEACENANELGTRVFEMMQTHGIAQEHVGVDTVGVGVGTFNKLLEHGVQVQSLKGGSKPEEDWSGGFRMDEAFENLRAQMWWQLRTDLQFGEESGIVLPMDEELFVDLTTPRFDRKKDRVIWVESKDDIKKRLGRSTNKGDSVVYWNWVRRRRSSPVAVEVNVPRAQKGQIERELAASPFRARRKRWWE